MDRLTRVRGCLLVGCLGINHLYVTINVIITVVVIVAVIADDSLIFPVLHC